MISARLDPLLVGRLEFVAKNTDAEGIKNRTDCIAAALAAWLPGQEKRVGELLGTSSPKKGR